jgi:hypothetical protein
MIGTISSRTPEGRPFHCRLCGLRSRLEPSCLHDDATCPGCGQLIWDRDWLSAAVPAHNLRRGASTSAQSLVSTFRTVAIRFCRGLQRVGATDLQMERLARSSGRSLRRLLIRRRGKAARPAGTGSSLPTTPLWDPWLDG